MLRSGLSGLLRRLGFVLVRTGPNAPLPPDIDPEAAATIRASASFTMTGVERQFALIEAVRYVVRSGIPGDIVECGVYRGGAMMAVARTLQQLDAAARTLWLYDTFAGMTPPTSEDVDLSGVAAATEYARRRSGPDRSSWCLADELEVRANLARTGYPPDRLVFVAGPVEQTIPTRAPSQVALLRLDTDWYASTRHALEHLYPRLAPGGVLIIDDYGHWRGARRAVDEYFAGCREPVLLQRIDYTGRLVLRWWPQLLDR
jgi:hypothetical protein